MAVPQHFRLAAGDAVGAATEGKLLFLEDAAPSPIKSTACCGNCAPPASSGVRGIVFGEMLDCASPGAASDLLEQAILSALDGSTAPSPSACAAATSRARM